MIRLFNALIGILEKLACKHRWKVHCTVDVKSQNGEVVEIEETLFCKECGKIKKIKL